MIAEDFQYKECMINYVTKHLHSQEKTSTATTPYDAALNHFISRIDEPLFKDNDIFCVTALRDGFCKYLESHGVHNVTSYRSQYLIAHLRRHYEVGGNCKIMVVPQKGCSSLICSAKMNFGCMLSKLKELPLMKKKVMMILTPDALQREYRKNSRINVSRP